MDQYITGAMIKRLREKGRMTQTQLAQKLGVSDKAISKWETGRGYPDITLTEPLAASLGVSVIELFAGQSIVNTNRASNLLRAKLYVCPICGNVIQSTGEAVVSCCGVTLPALEAESPGSGHPCTVERIEDEYYVSVSHEMSKTHFISFIAAVKSDGVEFRKLYPEGSADARFRIEGVKEICYYCNRHGLFRAQLKKG